MKLLIIVLLISINSYADVRVDVHNTFKDKRYGAEFETQSDADTWIAEQVANDSWGKKERWVLFVDQTNCLEKVEVYQNIDDISIPYPDPIPDEYQHPQVSVVDHENCKLPIEYVITQTDITQEVNDKKDKIAACDELIERLKTEDLKLDELNKLARCDRGL